MNEKTLSKRLQLVASFLPKNSFFADIGSDHAYLPCYVCLKDKEARAIAGEINEGPYQSARSTINDLNLTNRIEVRKGDGLQVLNEDEVEQIVIAGMGGGLIAHILETGKDKLNTVSRLIAQPNVDAHAVRKWFHQNNYSLVNEQIINEGGHIYEVLVADAEQNYFPYSSEDEIENEFLFGPFLLQEKSRAFIEKWQVEKQKREHALSEMKKAKYPNNDKINQFKKEINAIEEVISSE